MLSVFDLMLEDQNDKIVSLKYTNYRGEISMRQIKPLKIWFGESEWHQGKQWLLEAFDIEKKATRLFAMKDVQEVVENYANPRQLIGAPA